MGIYLLSYVATFIISSPRNLYHFIFSTIVDGKIKAWLYDNMGSRVDYEYDAPGH
ncbi:hypothetical protein REPUB_Repub01dG0084900 [Reevesia pubescens]